MRIDETEPNREMLWLNFRCCSVTFASRRRSSTLQLQAFLSSPMVTLLSYDTYVACPYRRSKELPKCAACKPWPGPCVYSRQFGAAAAKPEQATLYGLVFFLLFFLVPAE